MKLSILKLGGETPFKSHNTKVQWPRLAELVDRNVNEKK